MSANPGFPSTAELKPLQNGSQSRGSPENVFKVTLGRFACTLWWFSCRAVEVSWAVSPIASPVIAQWRDEGCSIHRCRLMLRQPPFVSVCRLRRTSLSRCPSVWFLPCAFRFALIFLEARSSLVVRSAWSRVPYARLLYSGPWRPPSRLSVSACCRTCSSGSKDH